MSERVVWKSRLQEVPEPALVEKYGTVLASLLSGRGLKSVQEAERFLQPRLSDLESPFRLANLKEACERICQALVNSELIAVYGDYDIDGMSALSILRCYFESISYTKVIHYIPHRFDEGYGMNLSAVEHLAQQGVRLVITVDTGITAVDPIARARELGLDVIVTDHHLAASDLPDTPWIVNPNSGQDASGLSYLSGAGVAFYLCMGLNILLKEKNYFEERSLSAPNLKEFLDLFSLGTVSDQMKLVGDNRTLVSAGLKVLQSSSRAGIRELVRRCIDLNKGQVTARDVGFSIGPKLNAASRLGQAPLSVELLSCCDPVRAQALTDQLLELNSQRIAIQDEVTHAVRDQLKHQHEVLRAPVLVGRGAWHEGVLGIVASKMVEEFAKPVIVLAEHEGELKGSMRSLGGVSCVGILKSVGDLLCRFGGHREAAGLQLKRERFEEFLEGVWSNAHQFVVVEQSSSEIFYDLPFPEGLSLNDVLALEQLSPFGQGNPDPCFLVQGLSLDRELKTLKEQHVKFCLDSGFEVIGFFKAKELFAFKEQGAKVDVLLTPEINRFRGVSRVQLRLEHIREHAPA